MAQMTAFTLCFNSSASPIFVHAEARRDSTASENYFRYVSVLHKKTIVKSTNNSYIVVIKNEEKKNTLLSLPSNLVKVCESGVVCREE